jgi:glutathione synthase/RimK-type ligase-like ATP-grasp enzyme
LWIQPYKAKSTSARRLKEELKDLICDKAVQATHVLNWGNSKPFLASSSAYIINHPEFMGEIVNKKSFFELMNFINESSSLKVLKTPVFFTTKADCISWMSLNPGKEVVCRTILNGSDGKGIVISSNPEEVPECDLYTEYIKKKNEYRVHVFGADVIKIQKKKRKSGAEINEKIRNTSGGWIFSSIDVSIPEDVLDDCIALKNALGINFGAFDIIHNEYYNKWYVLECNSAPGIEGSTVKVYADAIRKILGML